jgi:hypothetical protein
LRHLLRDHSAQREPENVASRKAQTLEERERMRCHAGYRLRHLSGGPSDSGVVEEEHFASRRERIGDRRISVVERAREMLQAQ